jgi:serine/threonine-protein kinase
MTKTNAVIGSPHYMSPEQMRSVRNVDARTDIWAIGIILYELLSGAAPFVADTLPELVLKIATEPPPPIRSVAPRTPPRLEAVIQRCLERDLARRFATIGELAFALADFGPPRSRLSLERISGVLGAAGMSQRSLEPARVYDSPTMLDAGNTAAAWGQTSNRSSGGRRLVLIAGAVLTLGALGVVGYAVQQRGVAPPPSAGSMAVAAPSFTQAPPAVTSAEPPHLAPEPAAPPAPSLSPPPLATVAPLVPNVRRPGRPSKPAVKEAAPAPTVAPPKIEAKPPEAAPAPPPRPKSTGSVFDER